MSERSRLDGKPIIAQIGYSPSDEILLNVKYCRTIFPGMRDHNRHEFSRATIYAWARRDFSFRASIVVKVAVDHRI